MPIKSKLKKRERWFMWLAYARIISEITIILGMAIILYLLFMQFT
ncbi:MAG: hypothetical protein ACTSYA_06635 [Candidatus Kariarchaeaceae archaeon]